MAMITYPLNDIEYSAEDAELFHCTRSSGVFAGDDFNASVTGSDNIVSVAPGIAWIRNAKFKGKVVAQRGTESVELPLSDSLFPRIDAIVLQFNANANKSALIYKQGEASAEPVPPEVVRTESVYELHLFHVRREAASSVIVEADITDLRQNAEYCGIMADDVTAAIEVAVDATLTQAGKAADAKATGEAIERAAVKYTLTKDANGDIVLAGSDGSTSTVTDETASGEDYSGMQMLINEELEALSFSTTNTLWRFAIIEITSPTNSDVFAVVSPYHALGYFTVRTNISLRASRTSKTTKWELSGVALDDFVISRIRAYR